MTKSFKIKLITEILSYKAILLKTKFGCIVDKSKLIKLEIRSIVF